MDPNPNNDSHAGSTPPAAPSNVNPAPSPTPPIPAPSPPAVLPAVPVAAGAVINPNTPAPTPPAAPTAPSQPVVMVGGDFTPDPGVPIAVTDPAKPTVGRGPSRWKSKKLLIPLIAIPFIFASASAFYFGYYMNPDRIYAQSLSNTGKGYDKLIDYIDTQSQVKKQNYTGNGSYKYVSEGFSTDGKMSYQGDGSNNKVTFDFGLAGSRVNGEIRTFKSDSVSPDIYVKATGLTGIGGLTGSAELDEAINKVEDKWIFIDHTLLDTITANGTRDLEENPSREEIMDGVRAFGRVNQQYVFTTAKDKAVTIIVKKHGVENVEGHKAYHYTVGLQKENVKKYIEAQRAALKASKLGAWLKKNNYEKEIYSWFDESIKAADDIKSSDTFEMWMDVNKRIIYKVRLPDDKNPATNYAEIGLDYKGGDSYPFFISGQSKNSGGLSKGALVVTLNAKTHALSFKINSKFSGEYGGAFTADFNYKPTSAKITIDKPADARPLPEVLNELGLGDVLSQYTGAANTQPAASGGVVSGMQAKAKDSERKSDIRSLQTQLEVYFAENGYYPTLQDLNNSSWVTTNMKSLDQTALADPDNPDNKTLKAASAAKSYAYAVTDGGGKSCEANRTLCAKFVLTATLSDGSKDTIEALI